MRHADEVEEDQTEHERTDERRDRVRQRDLAEPVGQERDGGADRLLVARDREGGVRVQEETETNEEKKPADDAPPRPAVRPSAQLGGGRPHLRRKPFASVLGVRRGLVDERAHQTNDRVGDLRHRPARCVRRRREKRDDRAAQVARGPIEHRAEIAAETANEAVRRRGSHAAERGVDVGARELRRNAKHSSERADEVSRRVAQEGHEDEREQYQQPAIEEWLQQVKDLGHRTAPFSCSASLSGVVAAHARKTGARAPSDLNIASQSFCPLP